jgi:hypothetical protein
MERGSFDFVGLGDGAVRCRVAHRVFNRRQNSFYSALHVVGRDSQSSNSKLKQQSVANLVAILLFPFEMDAAVHLNGQPMPRTVKVEHESTNGMLSSEFQSVELPVPKCRPKHCFGLR